MTKKYLTPEEKAAGARAFLEDVGWGTKPLHLPDYMTPNAVNAFYAKGVLLEHGHWGWSGTKRKFNGHGRYKPPGQAPMFVHRLAWEMMRGPLAKDDRLIRNEACPLDCFNPAHHTLGSEADVQVSATEASVKRPRRPHIQIAHSERVVQTIKDLHASGHSEAMIGRALGGVVGYAAIKEIVEGYGIAQAELTTPELRPTPRKVSSTGADAVKQAEGVVRSVAASKAADYRSLLPSGAAEDIAQELRIWIYKHPLKVLNWLDPSDSDGYHRYQRRQALVVALEREATNAVERLADAHRQGETKALVGLDKRRVEFDEQTMTQENTWAARPNDGAVDEALKQNAKLTAPTGTYTLAEVEELVTEHGPAGALDLLGVAEMGDLLDSLSTEESAE